MKRLVVVSSVLVILAIIYNSFNIFKAIDVPTLETIYWGPGKFIEDDTSIRQFNIQIKRKDIDDIYNRLSITRILTETLENTQTQYGFNGNILKEIINFLKNDYNFTERVNFLNSLPQYKTQIQGLDLHFLHVKSNKFNENVKVLPILLLHGWPSSVREFYEIITELEKIEIEENFVFEVIAPSLPGFGYSDGAKKKDFQAPEIALLFKNLMNRLGHTQFYVHGSDWGAVVSTNLATLFPKSVLGHHSVFCVPLLYKSLLKIGIGSIFPSLVFSKEYQHYWYPLTKSLRYLFSEAGYFHMQGTKPDTIGVALDQSLEGLLAFTLEKISVGTNKNNIFRDDAGLSLKYNYTTLLDIIIFYYWIPEKATTAARFYAENSNIYTFARGIQNIPIDKTVPCGCLFPMDDFFYFPESILKDKYTNLIHHGTLENTGHFAALERPDALVKDLISFVNKTLL